MTDVSYNRVKLAYLSKDPSELLAGVQVGQQSPGTTSVEGH
jgi:hypothetical protein